MVVIFGTTKKARLTRALEISVQEGWRSPVDTTGSLKRDPQRRFRNAPHYFFLAADFLDDFLDDFFAFFFVAICVLLSSDQPRKIRSAILDSLSPKQGRYLRFGPPSIFRNVRTIDFHVDECKTFVDIFLHVVEKKLRAGLDDANRSRIIRASLRAIFERARAIICRRE
ncbi:MAG TPA: hypothetical protein VM557_13275 [Thermoanaerobaculia bacterium]|nr:hypothetical protein [Thermoanaerobaculia bacterium]